MKLLRNPRVIGVREMHSLRAGSSLLRLLSTVRSRAGSCSVNMFKEFVSKDVRFVIDVLGNVNLFLSKFGSMSYLLAVDFE